MQSKAEYTAHSDTEFLTRLQRIDVALEESGWKVKSRAMVIEELDTKQSNFKKRIYKVYKETYENELPSKYADYLLLDSNGDPLAVIEAKKTTKDPIAGQKQAEEYVNDIKSQISRYREVEHEHIVYDNPKDIIDRVLKKEDEIGKELNELRKTL